MFFTRLMAVLTILATLCVAGQIALQVVEMQDYEAPPSVWPMSP